MLAQDNKVKNREKAILFLLSQWRAISLRRENRLLGVIYVYKSIFAEMIQCLLREYQVIQPAISSPINTHHLPSYP